MGSKDLFLLFFSYKRAINLACLFWLNNLKFEERQELIRVIRYNITGDNKLEKPFFLAQSHRTKNNQRRGRLRPIFYGRCCPGPLVSIKQFGQQKVCFIGTYLLHNIIAPCLTPAIHISKSENHLGGYSSLIAADPLLVPNLYEIAMKYL